MLLALLQQHAKILNVDTHKSDGRRCLAPYQLDNCLAGEELPDAVSREHDERCLLLELIGRHLCCSDHPDLLCHCSSRQITARSTASEFICSWAVFAHSGIW